ncbi:protein TALPID3 isoform X2 [Hemicordylus capensis]|uniref:protein TALPID3 isoform X2 n=1 Tax=Hemicordylus capensis TaxID=884348 RepID=UPI0023045900|nr:protein TALPID3 isoform X2 [Hemicordylus capensis]
MEESSGLSEDSLASLTAGDVLIHSTSVHMKEKPLPTRTAVAGDSRPAACTKKRIRISLKKLREVPPPCRPECSMLIDDEAAYIPPALLTNKPAPCKPTTATSGDVAKGAVSTCTGRLSDQLRSTEKVVQPSHLSAMVYTDEAALSVPLVKGDGIKQEAADFLISQYDTGQREAARAVFKQRIQSVPVFKEVKVQLLDNPCPDKKDSTKSTRSEMDSATTIAAATAAAIASTAPLLKVQSDLEAKVNSVSEILNKLQETDKHLLHIAEQQQASLKPLQSERPPCQEIAGELEKRMNLFMEQRIQHLEKLQQQQMNIQSHLISSALSSSGFPAAKVVEKHMNAGRPVAAQPSSRPEDLFSTSAVYAPACSRQLRNRGVYRQRSPLKTPTPRRYAPVPVSKDAKVSPEMSKNPQPIGEKENVHKSSYRGTLGGGGLLEQILNSQETPLSQSASSQKEPATDREMPWHLGRERTSAAVQMEPFPAFKSSAQDLNSVERTVKKADSVLHDLGQLKREMHDMLQDAKEWKSDMNNFMKPKDPVAPSLNELQELSRSAIVQSTKASKSILRDAEKILRGVRKNKKVLEENLEAIIRAKDGNAMHAFIDALTADRDMLEEIRIRKTVDEWIKTISREIQDEMARKDFPSTQTIKHVKPVREIRAKSRYLQGISTKRLLPVARTCQKEGSPKTSKEMQNEEHLTQIYGRPIYQGHRSTLKRAPYLRFNSPSPKSKPPRPKLVECVRGTRLKSARTQTSNYVYSEISSLKKSRPFSAPRRELQYLFSPTKEAPDVSGPLEGHLIPMAIPLGQKQIDRISPQPAGIMIGEFHPVSVTTSVPPAPPKPRPKMKKPSIAVIEMKSEKKDPPKLTVQVLPNVDIDSISSNSSSVNQICSTPLLTKDATQIAPEDSQQEDEERKLPGTDFTEIPDASQDEEDENEIPEFTGPVLEFNRRGEIESPKYNGPPFPPAPPPAQPSADILDDIIEKRETLENKLVGWVEQEVMARVISRMYPAQKEAVPNISSSESEDSEALSSDIVEAAGTGGFQLFVNAGVPVDSEMIRHFVSEALAETVAVMLGDRESQKAASATGGPSGVNLLPQKETVLSTPLATPQATPPPSPPPLEPLSRVNTPESSPSTTEIGDIGEQQLAAGSEAAARNAVCTPVATPVATPPRIGTPSPPASELALDRGARARQVPLDPWGDAELPLDEEKPSPQSEEAGYHPRAVIMSVAKHEEPDSLVLPTSPEQVQPHNLLLQEPRIPSPSVHTPSSGPSTEESSLTVTETETVDRPISEGEVLYSYGQLLATRALAEGGLSLPNLSDSLTSTLHDAHDMDYDPPSEGQVVRRPHKGYHRDPVLSLFSKLNQAPLASQEEICQSEGTDDSAGELSEGQRPRLTTAAESILMGRSTYMGQPTVQISEQQPRRPPSPGQVDRVAGEVPRGTDITHGPMSIAELDQPAPPTAHLGGRLAPHLDDTSQGKPEGPVQAEPRAARVIRVRTKSDITQQQDFQRDMDRTCIEPSVYLTSLLAGGETTPPFSSLPVPTKMSVKVPSANIDDQPQSFSSIHGSSDSSGADTF